MSFISVIGIGNILLKDEGVGVHVVNRLRKRSLPEKVKLFDCGTDLFSLISALEGCEKAIIIDAGKFGGKPGEIRCFKLKNSMESVKLVSSLSLHDIDVVKVLSIASKTFKFPEEIFFVCIEPKEVGLGLNLSQEVNRSIPSAVKLVIDKVKEDEII